MPRRRRSRIFIALLLAVPTCLWLLGGRPVASPPEVSFWYWHHPFRLPAAEVSQLRALGVRQLFVHAGTFEAAGRGVRMSMPQQWASPAPGLAIHLVYRFSARAVRGFERLSIEAVARTVCETFGRERARAEAAGVHVAGIQLDLDCPTRLLPRYADLLRRVRAGLAAVPGRRTALSVTALPTWFTSRGVRKIVSAVEFTVPQYYEARTGRSLAEFATISRATMLPGSMRAVARYGGAFYVGLPAYGHSLVYDAHGSLAGANQKLSLPDAARHPGLRFRRAFAADATGRPATPATYVGEDIVEFEPADPVGASVPGRLVYDIPTDVMLRQHLAAFRSARPRHCRGVVLFRYPEADEVLSLPLPALAAALREEPAQPHLEVRLGPESIPWALIDLPGQAGGVPVGLSLRVTNDGSANTFFAPDAVELLLAFDRPGLEFLEPGDFDAAETFTQAEAAGGSADVSRALRCSPRRANLVRLRRFGLRVGETTRAGSIRIAGDGPTRVWGTWRIRLRGGFETVEGRIPQAPLTVERSAGR